MGGLFHNLRHPPRSYVVCAVPRSGSNLLTDGLHATRRAGRPKQFFLRKYEPYFTTAHNLNSGVDFVTYVRSIITATATSNEIFGFKLMSWYLDDFLTRLRETRAFGDAPTGDLELLRNAFPRLQFVHISRRHKLRQALSKARAVQTDLWKVQEGKTGSQKPQFDTELIEQCLAEGEQQEKIWERFFQRLEIDAFRVEYEKLCQDYETTVRGVLDFLQISLPRRAQIGPPMTVRQADDISRAWEERFLAERSALQPLART
ncbi:MAG: Stf0 family sulfotransferase [Verrucomicrobiota bacterium]|nr:Stf0 family sulfotransferase [Verrucomicrobiota bacterium]